MIRDFLLVPGKTKKLETQYLFALLNLLVEMEKS